jgi:hypothetical protein
MLTRKASRSLSDTDQALEAARVEGAEDAADHPERPAHTYREYERRPDCLPPERAGDRKKASPEESLLGKDARSSRAKRSGARRIL